MTTRLGTKIRRENQYGTAVWVASARNPSKANRMVNLTGPRLFGRRPAAASAAAPPAPVPTREGSPPVRAALPGTVRGPPDARRLRGRPGARVGRYRRDRR